MVKRKVPTPLEIIRSRENARMTTAKAAEVIGKSPRMWWYYECGRYDMPAVLWEVWLNWVEQNKELLATRKGRRKDITIKVEQ